MISKMTDNVNVIAGLNSRPNLRDGLTDEELKAKFDEAATLIKEYINNVLIPDIEAKNIPTNGALANVEGETVLEALGWLKGQIENVQAGQIVESSVGFSKLSDEVKIILNSGKPYVGETAPNSSDLPVGQLWLKTEGNKIASLNILLANNEWLSYAEPVLPVSKGGTGLDKVSTGAMLYGNSGKIEALETPSGSESLLCTENGKPSWKSLKDIKTTLGVIGVANGKYVGDGQEREIVLSSDVAEITPILIYVYRKDGAKVFTSYVPEPPIESYIVLSQGAQALSRRNYSGSTNIKTNMTVNLSKNKLCFSTEEGNVTEMTYMNQNNTEYCWTALY